MAFLFFVATLVAAAFAQDIQSALTEAGIAAVFPGDSAYDTISSPYNLRFDPHPETVTFPSTVEEVSQVVKIAADNGVGVVARSGGHSYIANGLYAPIIVDLRNMTSVTVSDDGTAVIQTGNRLGDVAVALNNAGRAIPHGSCTFVGIGGHAGHGGFGFASRMWGLALDVIQEMEVVLANGSIVTASNDENPDLFWAMRGTASSFGVTTSIKVQTFEAPSYAIIYGYNWNLDYNTAASALEAYQTFVNDPSHPPELGSEINLGRGSEQGTVYFELLGGWYGQAGKLNSTLEPFLSQLPTPEGIRRGGDGTYIGTVAYLGGGQASTKGLTQPTDTFYAKSIMVPQAEPLNPEAALSFMKFLAEDGFNSDTQWFMQVELYGGHNSAIQNLGVDDTSFAYRDTLFTMQLYASSSNSEPPYPDDGFVFVDNAVSSVTGAMPENWNYGAYLNYIDDHLDNFTDLYYGDHYSRLQDLKKALDPNDLFQFPTSVSPSPK